VALPAAGGDDDYDDDSLEYLSQHARGPTPLFGSGEAHEPTAVPVGAPPLPREVLCRVPAAPALSSRQERTAAAQRAHRAWFLSAAPAAASLSTVISTQERAARAAARVRLLDVLGPVYGATPDTVGTAHLARPLRWHRVARETAQAAVGPASHPITHAAQELVSQRYVWHWRVNYRFGPPRAPPPRVKRARTPQPVAAPAPRPRRRARSVSPPPRPPPSPPVVILSDFCALAAGAVDSTHSPLRAAAASSVAGVYVTPPTSAVGPPTTGASKDYDGSPAAAQEGKPGGILWDEVKAGGMPWSIDYDGAATSGGDDADDDATADDSGDDAFWGTPSPTSPAADGSAAAPSSALAPTAAPAPVRRRSGDDGGASESKWAPSPTAASLSPHSAAGDHLPPEARKWAAGEARYIRSLAAVRVDRRTAAELDALANATRKRAVRHVPLGAGTVDAAAGAAARRARGEAEGAARHRFQQRQRRRRSLDGLLDALAHSDATLARLRRSAAGVLAAADALQAVPLTHGDIMPAAPAVTLLPPVVDAGGGRPTRAAATTTPAAHGPSSAFYAPGRRATSWLAAQRVEEEAAAVAAARRAASDAVTGQRQWYASQLHRSYTPTRAAYLAVLADEAAYDVGVRMHRWAGGTRQRLRAAGAPPPGRNPQPLLSEAFTAGLPPQPPTSAPGGGGGGGMPVDMARSRGRSAMRSLRRLGRRTASADAAPPTGAVEVPFAAPPPPDGTPGPGAYPGVAAAADALKPHVAGVAMALATGRAAADDDDTDDDTGGGGGALLLNPHHAAVLPRAPATNFGAGAARWSDDDDDDGDGVGGGRRHGDALALYPEVAAAYLRDGRYRSAPNFGAARGRGDSDDDEEGGGSVLLLEPSAARDRVGARPSRGLAVNMSRATGRGDDDDDDGGYDNYDGAVLALACDAGAALYAVPRAVDFGRAPERPTAADDGVESVVRALVEGERRLRSSEDSSGGGGGGGDGDATGFFIAPDVLELLARAAPAPGSGVPVPPRPTSVPSMRYMAGREEVGTHYAMADVAAHAYYRDMRSDAQDDVLAALAGRYPA